MTKKSKDQRRAARKAKAAKKHEERKAGRRETYVADSERYYAEERPFMQKLSEERPDVYALRVAIMARYREQALAQGVPDRWVLANMRRILHGREPLPYRGGTTTGRKE